MDIKELVNKAIEGRERSYSPYSNFKVGASLLMKDGKYVMGTNIENSAYGCSMCAERVTMFHAHMLGYNLKKDVVAMAVVGDTKNPISPCGSCRQVMNELLNKDTPVILANLKGMVKEETVTSLLPYGFDDLG